MSMGLCLAALWAARALLIKKHQGDLTREERFHKQVIIPPGRVVPSARSLANDVAVSKRRPPSRE